MTPSSTLLRSCSFSLCSQESWFDSPSRPTPASSPSSPSNASPTSAASPRGVPNRARRGLPSRVRTANVFSLASPAPRTALPSAGGSRSRLSESGRWSSNGSEPSPAAAAPGLPLVRRHSLVRKKRKRNIPVAPNLTLSGQRPKQNGSEETVQADRLGPRLRPPQKRVCLELQMSFPQFILRFHHSFSSFLSLTFPETLWNPW